LKKTQLVTILAILMLFPLNLFCQKDLLPELSNTYGNRLHTDRDEVLMTFTDAENDIYMIGITESDFTFRDIKIIKLDQNLNELWAKQLSYETRLSLDNLKDAFIDSKNNLYVIVSPAYSSNQQTRVIVKFDPQGNKLWEYAFSDIKDPEDFDFSFDLISLDQQDNLHMAYRPRNYEYLKYHFLTFSPEGEVIEDFTKDDLFKDPAHGYVYNNHANLGKDNIINMLYKIEYPDAPYQEFRLRKFNATDDLDVAIELDADEINFINTPFDETYTTISNDSNGNLAFIVPNYEFYKDFMVLYFNEDGSIRYKQKQDPLQDRFLLNHKINTQDNLLIFSNNRASDTSDQLVFTLQIYNPQGELIFENHDNQVLAASVYLHDKLLTVYSDKGEIITYDYQLNRLNQKTIKPINNYSFSLNALLHIDGNTYFSATTYDKKYPKSELLSEQNFIMRKMDHEKEIASYTYDGPGTSRVFFNYLRMVDGNYVLSATEKVGAELSCPGCRIAPKIKYKLTYDKDLNLIKEEIIDDIDYTYEDDDYPEEVMEYHYKSPEGVDFKYTVSSDYNSFSCYKNDVFQWTRNLSLTNADERGISFVVDKNGDFIVSSSDSFETHKMHRTSLENVYLYVNMPVAIYKVLPLSNSWFGTFADDTTVQDDNIWILSPEFTLIHKTFSEISVNPIDSHFIEKNSKLVYWVEGENNVWILNQFAEVEEQYNMDMTFHSDFYLYDGNYLINTDMIFHYIVNYYPWQWSRGVIEKYNLDLSYLIEDPVAIDLDQDGIDDSIDRCRNTEMGAEVNAYGCSQLQVLATDDLSANLENIEVYPNPAKDKLFLTIPENTIIDQLSVFDYTGKKIFMTVPVAYKTYQEIDLSKFSKGIYIVKVTFENGALSQKKFIVE